MSEDVLRAAEQKAESLREMKREHDRQMSAAQERTARADADAAEAQAELEALVAQNAAARKAFSEDPFWAKHSS